ncbi:hypothetical protein M0R04_11025 [Candidatus Dojkabacteria bacterium]|jgi:intracellular septation protein A|nr:hypothetical protein [Candidatus Dojkabacteria bacterium]
MDKSIAISNLRTQLKGLLNCDIQQIDLTSLYDSTLPFSQNKDIIIEDLKQKGLIKAETSKEDIKAFANDIKEFEAEEKEQLKKAFASEVVPIDSLALKSILKENRIIGVVGNPNSAKTSLTLVLLTNLKKEYPKVPIYAFGVAESLIAPLKAVGITTIYNKEDILDLKLTGSIVYCDEFADVFSVESRDKQFHRIKKFFNRIFHLNNWFILSTAQAGFWNKFMCGIVNCYLVKEIEYNNLVNGTTLKRKVEGLYSSSDYRFECAKDTYMVLTNLLTEKHRFEYMPIFDSKKSLVNPFKEQTASIQAINQKEKINYDAKKEKEETNVKL